MVRSLCSRGIIKRQPITSFEMKGGLRYEADAVDRVSVKLQAPRVADLKDLYHTVPAPKPMLGARRTTARLGVALMKLAGSLVRGHARRLLAQPATAQLLPLLVPGSIDDNLAAELL